jgi:ComF family protein
MRSLARIGATALHVALRGALDAVLPPRCLSCGTVVEDVGTLCSDCWRGLTFLTPPCCDCCGFPFPFEAPAGTLCVACSRARPAFDRARAVFRYDDASRPLILGFKHADETHAAPAYGRWLGRAGAALIAEADLIAPVPLHRWRLLARRYNQAALLAAAVAGPAGARLAVDLLARRRHTPQQGRLSRLGRRRNVRGAFGLRPRWEAALPGKRVLLVDDVLTTGATVEQCARVLRRHGAAGVDVLTLARVVRAQ